MTPPSFKYDVFLSFRGEDTRYNFTSHLHKALIDKQIQTFFDHKLNRGDEISPSLQKAIEESQISVVIFTKNYASSTWCLQELVHILECKEKYLQVVIPVFLNIDPSDLRNQTGDFADAFKKHEDSYKYSLDKVQRWKNALKEASNLSGFDSSFTRCESEIIQEIVEDILKKLNDRSPSDNSNLVGIGSKIKEIESLLCLESKIVHRIGIWGIGGIGKTTLAIAIFDKISNQFEGSCFIDNIREESEKHGLRCLRQELLSTILGDENVNVCTTFLGRTFTKTRLIHKKLLVVFDDVTDFKQIEYLIEGLDCFDSRSRIIITTRDKQVLRNCSVDQIYEVKELSHCEARNLLCQHAFRQNLPTGDYSLLLEMAVRYARGIPLALKVLGSFLLDKKVEVWRSAMDKLKRIPHMDVQKVLRITYDGLDDEMQNIFLDIACFFKGKDVDLVKELLDACGFFTEIGINTLIDKSMITISNDNKIMMHDLLQAMGREIIRQESIENPGKLSRLWHHEDIYHVLTKNTGTEKIEGISLDMSNTRDIHLGRHAFVNMRRLRFLKFFSSRYEEDINKVHNFPGLETNFTELRYFHWHGYPEKSLLSNIHLANLVTLAMPYSNVEQLWSGIQYLCRLKEIDLSCSKHLTSLPDFSGFPNLKRLILVGCTSLREIPSSIQSLHKLDFLDLTDCKSLEYLPDCVNLESLRKLYLSGCSNLKILPEIASNIEELYLDETAIQELPSSIEYLCRLVLLDVKSCSKLKSLPNNICNWKSLKRLNLSDCSQLESLPNEIGSLESLMELEAEGTAIKEVPASIKCLNNLNMLSVRRYYTNQETVGLLLPPLLDLHHLRELDLTNCGIMKIPDSLSNLTSLKRLYLCKNNFESMPAIINLSNLSELNICNCERLQHLPLLPLISIDAHGCTSLEPLLCLSVVGTIVSKDQPFIFVNFANSVKLDWNVCKYILENALLQMQHLATLWKQEYYDKEWDMMPRACICYPGSEVPDWFHYRNKGSFINVELPRNWFSPNFVSFALCVVVAFRDHQDYDWGLVIHFECKYRCVPDSTLASNTSTCGLPCYINSDHVFMGFDFHLYPSKHIGESCQNNEVSFQFYIKRLYDGKKIECCTIRECGVRLMYALKSLTTYPSQGLGKSNGSVSSCKEMDEPRSKRCKFL